MTRTALYEDAKFPEEEMAVGYGGVPYGDVNSPSHWGRTSWLVLGSGGMVSTTGDLYRWISGIRSGKILTEHQWPDYWSPPGSILEGGSENGFVAYYTEGPGSLMILLSNSGLGNERTRRLAHDLAALVNKPRYRLGVSIAFSHEAITIQDVQQGTPAHTAGLRSGDVILAANGQPLDPHEGQGPLMDLIRAGETLKLKVRHEDGTEQELSIKPRLPE
jgi:CubicO group peptidase (beta-lactamase class C family)